MNDLLDIKEKIIDALYATSANDLPETCEALGMKEGTTEEAFKSKKSYVSRRLLKYDKKDILELLGKLKNQQGIDLFPNKNYTYKLTKLTVRDIIDVIVNGITIDNYFVKETCKIKWHGRVEEWAFISKVCNLEAITPNGRFNSFKEEYQQHRINNNDFGNDWFFTDDRFPFKSDNDADILDVLCYMFHPVVRNDQENWQIIYKHINELINADGFEFHVTKQISGRDVFGWRKIHISNSFEIQLTNDLNEKLSSEYLDSLIMLMVSNIESTPHIAIGKAKELIETVLKSILDEMGIDYKKSIEIRQLDKMARDQLFLNPSDKKKDIPGVNTVLSSLIGITVGMGELRNEYGDGHGKNIGFKQLPPRYARLAVSSATAYAYFLYDTFNWLKTEKKLPLNHQKSDKN